MCVCVSLSRQYQGCLIRKGHFLFCHTDKFPQLRVKSGRFSVSSSVSCKTCPAFLHNFPHRAEPTEDVVVLASKTTFTNQPIIQSSPSYIQQHHVGLFYSNRIKQKHAEGNGHVTT